MAYMNWSPELSVGVKLFDDEHKHLVELLNKMYDGIVSGDSRETLIRVLDGLIKYTGTHFKHEEDYMLMYDYPDFEDHKKEHDNLVDEVVAYRERLFSGELNFSIELMKFLQDWVTDHIMKTDKNYGDFLSDKIGKAV